MKLLHVIASLGIGGAERLLSDILPIQKQQGLNVTLLVNVRMENAFTRQLENSGIEIISLDEPNIHSLKNIFLLRKIIKKYDVVHAHLFPAMYWVALASIGLKVKLVYTEHSTFNRRREKLYFRPIEKFIYSKYDKIISISRKTQEALQKWLCSADNRFIIINNGVNTRRFSSVQKPIIPKSLIMVSRFAAAKDQETLIRAMRFIDSSVVLRLVGEGETKDDCKRLAQSEGVADRVYFLGSRSDIPELVAESYIGVQSSHWEGFGLTAVELMAAGKPVIASDVDGLKQVVEGAGELFPKGNAKILAEKITHLLDDEYYYKAMADRCKQRAALYDIEEMAKGYKKVYDELTEN